MANEVRLIDANFTKAVIQNYIANNEVTEAFVKIAGHICGMLDNCETVDAVPVVHGRWVKKTTDYVYYYACSECGEPVLKSQWGNDFFSDYCPNCGAKMDGDGNA